MKRMWVVTLVFVGIIALSAILFNFAKSTGNVTLTSNANYGPVNQHKYFYVNCVYLNDNDGWSVITKGEIKYFNRLKGLDFIKEDSCLSSVKVKEFDCSGGYMAEREVICPPSMICKEGICVYPNF